MPHAPTPYLSEKFLCAGWKTGFPVGFIAQRVRVQFPLLRFMFGQMFLAG